MDDAGMKLLKRKLAWDLLPHGDDLQNDFQSLGLMWASDDVLECEHADSHQRMIPCMYLGAAIQSLSGVTSDIISSLMLNQSSSRDIEYTADLTEAIIRSASSVIIAHLMDTGFLKLSWKE